MENWRVKVCASIRALNGHVTRSSVHTTLLVHGLCSELGLIDMTSCTVPSVLNWVLHVILTV